MGLPEVTIFTAIKMALIASYHMLDEADEAQQALQNLRMWETSPQELSVKVKIIMWTVLKGAATSIVKSSTIRSSLQLFLCQVAQELEWVPYSTLNDVQRKAKYQTWLL